ncbi:hypothetical protein, variant 2 [Capsaspora owczarzaki ATCC 30864]|uniref:Phosphatidylethanolamine N-methyltransferase n=1 Tax=Capsaspora owczarzaki (strain ATCC 30864) TaxID=595528 RepID=A0A0D2WKZ3_CAPO3|nr:hypothetical protein, variant 1 [Capsaspora owczarzaki ATCC 30864]KJE91081.1 hypothetical protein, variant 2 [Capsaspora owczarzaki ATCC 30864]
MQYTVHYLVARREYKTRFLTRALGGKYNACYLLAFSIFTLGLLRDYLFAIAMEAQSTSELLNNALVHAIGAILAGAGVVFVLSSMWMLGVTGTYLGDYCDIFLDARVTGFPFSIIENPMYWGSTMNFVGVALWNSSPAGLVLSFIVGVVYKIALQYEGPFTNEIYRQRAIHKKLLDHEKRSR